MRTLVLLLPLMLSACDSGTPSGPPPRSPVVRLDVSTADTTLAVGARLALTAVARDSIGRALVARTILWSTGDARVAVGNDRGLVDAVAPGRTSVSAESEGRTATVAITVVAADACTAPTIALP